MGVLAFHAVTSEGEGSTTKNTVRPRCDVGATREKTRWGGNVGLPRQEEEERISFYH